MDQVESLLRSIDDAREREEIDSLPRKYCDLFMAMNARVTELSENTDEATSVLDAWSQRLDEAAPVLEDKLDWYLRSMLEQRRGSVWELDAQRAFLLNADVVEAPRLYEKAEHHQQLAAELAARVPMEEGASSEDRALLETSVAMHNSEAIRVSSMKALCKGQLALRSGDYARAEAELSEAVTGLARAATLMPRDVLAGNTPNELVQRAALEVNFVHYAEAVHHEARSEHALFRGDLQEAAEQQGLRAEALERSRQMHARARDAMHDAFSRRLARDVVASRRRHERFRAAAQSRPSIQVVPFFGVPEPPEAAPDIFMIMPFRDDLTDVYEEHICRAVKTCDMTVLRGDDLFSTESVTEDIWRSIAAAKLLIAECSGRNPNVYYEVGIAHTLGKPVILITQNPEDVPFDLRHLRYIHYDNSSQGLETLVTKLVRTIQAEAASWEDDPES